jgi:hypothetical protein
MAQQDGGNGDSPKTLSDASKAAKRLGLEDWIFNRRCIEGGGPAPVLLGTGEGSKRLFHQIELEAYVADGSAAIDAALDEIPDEALRIAARKAVPRWRRDNYSAVLPAILGAAKHCPERIPKIVGGALREAWHFLLEVEARGREEIELVGSRNDAERLRSARILERLPEWRVIDRRDWEVLEPRLADGIVIFESARPFGFRIGKGTSSVVVNMYQKRFGRTPLPRALLPALVELPDFRRALAAGELREVAVGASAR